MAKKIKKKVNKSQKFSIKPYAIRDVIITVCLELFGLISKTDHMVYVERGLPFRWLFANSQDTHINITRFGVDFLIILAIVIVGEIIWYFVKQKMDIHFEIRRKK